MAELGIATLAVLLWGGADELPSFPETWYREVFLGDIAGAAAEYQKLYLSPPSERLRPEMRQKAAFRAGLCFEMLEQMEYARLAYTSVPTAGPPAGPAVDDAVLRLKNLRAGDPPGPSRLPSGTTGDFAIQKLLSALQDRERARDEALSALQAELATRRARARQRGDLLDRLSRRGVVLEFPEDVGHLSLKPDEWLGSLRGVIRDEDVPRIQASLGDLFREKALQSIMARNHLAARTNTHISNILTGSTPLSESLLPLLEPAFPPDAASVIAERRFGEETLRRGAVLWREARTLLDRTEQMASERSRPDLVVEDAEKIRDLLDWVRPSLREIPEVRAMAQRAAKLFFLAGGTGGLEKVFGNLWRTARDQVERQVALSAEVVESSVAEARYRGPARNQANTAAIEACRAEAERLLGAAKKELEEGRADASFERGIKDVLHLLQWVSSIEDGRDYRRRADSLLEAKAARQESPAR